MGATLSTTASATQRTASASSATDTWIELDGSQGEGGGQILRTALALSVITGQRLRLHSIRAKRPKPGLMRQHLMCVQAAAAISGATVQGAELGAQALSFEPGPLRAGDYEFAIASAGSCMLVLQTVLPALMLADAPSTLMLRGGTHNHMAPSFHFVRDAFAPLVARLGPQVALTLHRHGFYPAGGGEVAVRITPAQVLTPYDLLSRGELQQGSALCLAPGVPKHVTHRELDALGQALGWERAQLQSGDVKQHEGPGNALIASLHYAHVTEVFVELGAKNVSAEQVAGRLVKAMRDYQKKPHAAVGPHLADQLVLLQALAVWQTSQSRAQGQSGQSEPVQASFSCSEVTAHLRTNCEVIERFLPVQMAIGREPAPVVRVTAKPR